MSGEEADNICAGDIQADLYASDQELEIHSDEHELEFHFDGTGHPSKITCSCGEVFTVTGPA